MGLARRENRCRPSFLPTSMLENLLNGISSSFLTFEDELRYTI